MALFQNPYSQTSILPPQGDIMNIIMMLRLLPLIQQMMQERGQGGGLAGAGITGGASPMTQLQGIAGTRGGVPPPRATMGGAQPQMMQGLPMSRFGGGLPGAPPQMPPRPF